MGYYDLILFLKDINIKTFRKVPFKTLTAINKMIREELGQPLDILDEPIDLPEPAIFDLESEQ